jgi:hypothetical protein
MPLRCIDWPTGQDLREDALLDGYEASGETIDLFADECAESTLVIYWVKRTSRSWPEVYLTFRTEVVEVALATSLKGSP